MKLNKHTCFSALFLFIFISAFSSGVYTSLSDSLKVFSHFSLHKELKQDKASSSSEELIFEESENDTEETTDASSALITSFLSFNLLAQGSDTVFTVFRFSEKVTGPIFLYIRALRI